jgi:hypothetical protein
MQRKLSIQTAALVLVGFVFAGLSGCAGTRAAYEAADGLPETALVVSEHYYALLREVNDLADAGAGESFVGRAQSFERQGTPIVLSLRNAAAAYAAIQSAENAEALQDALSEAAVLVSQLIDLIGEL